MQKLDAGAQKVKMRRLTKNRPYTWWGGPDGKFPQANLDHVVASSQLTFKQFSGEDIDIRGWPKETEAKQGAWIEKYSDHALLFFQVEK